MNIKFPTSPTSVFEAAIQPFVSGETSRYGLQHQWVLDGWRMASDSRIGVRVLTGEPNYQWMSDEGYTPRVPRMESIFAPYADILINEHLFTPINIQDCAECSSTGRVMSFCDECAGDGDVRCSHCDHVSECVKCKGKGQLLVHCSSCDDMPVSESHSIDCLYRYKIQALPHVRICHVEKKDVSLFLFDVDGMPGQGIVMQLSLS